MNKDGHITRADLDPRKITRIDVYYNHEKKPTTTHSANDLENAEREYLKRMILQHKTK